MPRPRAYIHRGVNASIIVVCVFVVCLVSLFNLYIFNCLAQRGFLYIWIHFLEETSPYFWASLGVAASQTLSTSGAAIGIYTTGVSILGAGVKAPHIKTKNLISIIFAEVVGIYGLIMAIILSGFTEDFEWQSVVRKEKPEGWLCGYLILGTGMVVGFVNLFCGISIGVIGSGAALADASNSSVFMKVLVIEIFASALGLYGLIAGIFIMSRAAWT